MQNRDIRGGDEVRSCHAFAGCFARFRVMARRRSGEVALVSLAWDRDEAVRLALAARDHELAQQQPRAARNGDGLAAIYLEAWSGSESSGRWVSYGPRHGGFCHAFHRATEARAEAARPGLPRSGTTVPCVLLAQKTRKGGWRASLADRPLAGPVTNSADVPSTAQPGQTVRMRVAAVSSDGKLIQFAWAKEAR